MRIGLRTSAYETCFWPITSCFGWRAGALRPRNELVCTSRRKGASREEGEHPGVVCVWVWVSGWAGDTRHVDVCWVDQEPTNQVASLDDFYKTPKPRSPVFKRIEGNWYFWADW